MRASHFSADTLEFIKILAQHDVRYMLVGGEAVIYYGFVRLTGDVDFFYDNSAENAEALYRALREFWQGEVPGISSADELLTPGLVIQFGVPPNRIDLLNKIDNVSFAEAWRGKKPETVISEGDEIPVFIIGLNELIKNKEKTGRPKDLEDLKYLRKAK